MYCVVITLSQPCRWNNRGCIHDNSLDFCGRLALFEAEFISRTVLEIQWNLWIADTYGTEKECPLLGGVRYSEVNLEGFHRIGYKIVCPLLRGVRYSACPLFRGFTVLLKLPHIPLYSHEFSNTTAIFLPYCFQDKNCHFFAILTHSEPFFTCKNSFWNSSFSPSWPCNSQKKFPTSGPTMVNLRVNTILILTVLISVL